MANPNAVRPGQKTNGSVRIKVEPGVFKRPEPPSSGMLRNFQAEFDPTIIYSKNYQIPTNLPEESISAPQNPLSPGISRPMPAFHRKILSRKRVMSPLRKLPPPIRNSSAMKPAQFGPVKQEEFQFAEHPYKFQRA